MAKMVDGKRRLSRERRLEQLLDCAIRVAAEKGLGLVVHADVAERAGVGAPNVFRYFPSRRDLLRGIVSEISKYYCDQADRFHENPDDPVKALQDHVIAFEESLETHPHYAAAWLQWCSSVQNDCGIWDMFQEHNNRLIKQISRTIRKAQPKGKRRNIAVSHARARSMLSIAFSLTTMKFSGADKETIDRFLGILREDRVIWF